MIGGQPKPCGWCYPLGSSIICGYDTSALFRENCLERIRQLQLEVEADMTKGFGWID